ncbi:MULTISPECIES: ribosome small subunit-dependent GTPase A [Lactobacillus]|jgi:ribosome biogenesis GTPase|uniref:Small ribosomal subunit biogenesis GTPase RsgA n=1 Tax=Lactobacillus gallinarum TaxID=52242 RepID=A0A1Y4TQS5_9LACO|nr:MULTISPECIES: ribosome small subunit-dependent GTPase A [Lactobacillus]MBL1058967.1 ribosome small subunit-dependent GTPase A [Lactobacillus sp. A27]MBM6972882.1 ribosome small subunit-dependent GTPase A [Lactobacillus gallinarum]MCC9272231.1 ribosome small subunit-dependent GTPase A [Lactobacillus gallinarum]MDM8276191.1 ribosome small subunit-dependent GTPase A [Lactobacillus gallinarum]OUQ47857.1 ribosome small subunit-dependent GTPase A [Lactobacillus gallinarum]
MKLAEGTVVGLIAGYYDVETAAGIVRTRARGVFRQKKQKPAVGDHVEIQIDDQGMSYLVKILPRLNRIGRPAVANVSHVLLVISAVEPDFSLELLDRFLTFFSWQKVQVTIYLSKSDLLKGDKLAKIKEELSYYQEIGYPVFTDYHDVEAQIPQMIKAGQIWTLAGQSGAGKSTLLNHLKKDANQATGAISTSLNRGKHTTRKVELFKLGEGFLADTPGFSSIDLTPIKLNELCNYFVEFKRASSKCKFRGCQHLKEPGCEVKKLLEEGQIMPHRYDDYLAMRTEISEGRLPEYLK